jgi:hypothetical protein
LSRSEDLLDAFQAIRAALLGNDSEALVNLVADDYCGFDPNGGMHDREMMLEAYGPGGVQLETYETKEVTTRVIGAVGLVMGVGALSGRYGEHEFEHRLRFLDVYVRRGSFWLLLVSQVTEITGDE